MKTTLLVAALAGAALSSSALAGTAYFAGNITTASSTFVNPGGSTSGSGIHFFDVIQFTVDLTGTYVIESASPNTGGTNSNALDTYLRLYANTFNPAAPTGALASNDDFTGALTVLPGPYAGTVLPASTGFTGAEPASRISTTLTAGVTYFLINTSFRQTNYVDTSLNGKQIGAYYTGISGGGNITLVPTPGAMGALAMGGLLASRRRRA